MEIDRIRIWDFFFLFPDQTKNISFPRHLHYLKQSTLRTYNPYDELTDPQRVFDQMKEYQLLALKYLVAYGFINSELLSKEDVERTNKRIPTKLLERMNEVNNAENFIIKLALSFADLPLSGEGGLKYRTKLVDIRYDPA
jgi:hypothetical protein